MIRRSFLGGILLAGVAPAFVHAKILMPVRTIWTPDTDIVGPRALYVGFGQRYWPNNYATLAEAMKVAGRGTTIYVAGEC